MNSVATEIQMAVDGTPGNNDMPGRIVLMTTADGGQAVTERLRIDARGALIVGGSASAGSGAAKAMIFLNGAAETAQTANSAAIFAQDISTVSTMHSQDEAETEAAF